MKRKKRRRSEEGGREEGRGKEEEEAFRLKIAAVRGEERPRERRAMFGRVTAKGKDDESDKEMTEKQEVKGRKTAPGGPAASAASNGEGQERAAAEATGGGGICQGCGKRVCRCIEELREKMEELTRRIKDSDADMRVGEGMYEDSAVAMVMREVIHQHGEISGIKGVLYRNYAVKKDSKYWSTAKEGRRAYHAKGAEVKGLKIDIGTPWGWAGGRMLMTITEDKGLKKEDKQEVEKEMFKLMGKGEYGAEGYEATIDMGKISRLHLIVGYVELTEGREENYITFGCRKGFEKVEEVMEKALEAEGGVKKADRPPSAPVRDMKKALMSRNKWGKGKGKGK